MKSPITRETIEDEAGRICLLKFDKPGAAVNTLDRETLDCLEERLAAIETDSGVAGVVFMSAKEGIFLAGADLGLLRKGTAHSEVLEEYLKMGQRLFNQVAGLTVPTVAAIDGACLGGGYELALACGHRIATPARATRIGLPETRLGILPAWGGSTRLPRLVGVPRALDLILNGKTPSARQALRLGMIDEIAPREWLLKAALRFLRERRRGRAGPSLLRRMAQRAVGAAAARQARVELIRRTRGHYPAVLKALEVVSRAWDEREPYASMERERDAVRELVSLPECRNLFEVFLLQERAKHLARHAGDGMELPAVDSAAVIGAGVMGAGIAQWLSAHGVRVILRDLDTGRVAGGMGRIHKLYEEAVRRRAMTAREARDGIDRVAPAPLEVPLERVGLVIEAAVEKLALKKEIFHGLDAAANPAALLATNTSALPVGELAAAAPGHEGRVLGLHFFNPVHRMPLVEVVVPESAAPESRAAALRFVQRIGKLPVVVRDTPGFLVNRILLPYLVEAAEAFDQGLGAPAVDEAMLAFGMPMGPLRLVDEVGLDIALHVARTLAEAYPERMRVPPLLGKMVEAGLLGRKAGRGFYRHAGGRGKVEANPEAEALRSGSGKAPERDEARSRMVWRMVDEAVRCLEEKVVETPGGVDFGMIMGAGFPPFRGGPLRYADAVGPARIVREMEALRLAPCDRLREMAVNAKRFYENENRE